jgi:hypothetical protein
MSSLTKQVHIPDENLRLDIVEDFRGIFIRILQDRGKAIDEHVAFGRTPK